MDLDLYTFLFEHFPTDRIISQAPLLLFPEARPPSSLTLTSLKERVDVLALGLWSHESLSLSRLIHRAETQEAGRQLRAIVCIHAQHDPILPTVVLACIKLGLAVVLASPHRMEDKDYARHLFSASHAQLLFTDSHSVSQECTALSHQTIIVNTWYTPSTSPSHALSVGGLNEAAYQQLHRVKAHGSDGEWQLFQLARAPLKDSAARDRVAFIVPRTDEAGVYHATHENVIAGILASQDLAVRVLQTAQTMTTLTALPMHTIAHLTLSLYLPLIAATPNIVASQDVDMMSIVARDAVSQAWLTDAGAITLTSRLRNAKVERVPASLAILQPGFTVNDQNELSTLLPSTSLFNAYAPAIAAGIICLEHASESGTLLGYPLPPTAVLIADRASGSRLSDGVAGRLVLKGPSVMSLGPSQPSVSFTDTTHLARLTPDLGIQLLHNLDEALSPRSSRVPASRPRAKVQSASTPRPVRTSHATAAVQKHHATIGKNGMNGTSATPTTAAAGAKKPVRDSKRRATHSQIERRRREKINDRLVTLRIIVPACAAEVEDRKRIKREEEEEARRIAAGEISASSIRGGKRKRNRRRAAAAKKEQDGDNKEEELGLHKLEVLTHTIDYIYELQARIQELETGVKTHRKRIDEEDDMEGFVEDGGAKDGAEEIGVAKVRRDLLDGEDDDGSEAHMEMAEWKGIRPDLKRHAGEAAMAIRPPVSRRSTSSSDSSSNLATSPAIPSIAGESPMFSATAASSVSNHTSLTSPMMSLSAESPIMRWNNQAGISSALPSPCANREKDSAFDKVGKMHGAYDRYSRSKDTEWQMLPDPVLPVAQDDTEVTPTKREQSRSLPSKSTSPAKPTGQTIDGGTAGERLGSKNDLDPAASSVHDDAHLLLAFGTSPEVFRPTSALRHTPMQRSQQRRLSANAALPRRQSSASPPELQNIHSPLHTTDQVGPHVAKSNHGSSGLIGRATLRMQRVGGRSIILGSAPGGAHASSSAALLPSPPLLALDGPSAPAMDENITPIEEDVEMRADHA